MYYYTTFSYSHYLTYLNINDEYSKERIKNSTPQLFILFTWLLEDISTSNIYYITQFAIYQQKVLCYWVTNLTKKQIVMFVEDVIVNFSKSIVEKDNKDDILRDLAKNCISPFSSVDCTIYSVENGKLIQKASFKPKDLKTHKPFELPIGEGITGYVAKTGIAEIINDTSLDSRCIESENIQLSKTTIPIAVNNTIYGVIDCEHPEKNYFTQEHLKTLISIAYICAVKLKSFKGQRQLLLEQQKNIIRQENLLGLRLKVLNSQMNPHFIFNTLNSIQALIISSDKKKILKYFSNFSKCTRYYFKKINEETTLLGEENKVLELFIQLQQLRFPEQFSFDFKNHSTEALDAEIPACVILVLFDNLLGYGIHHNQLKEYNLQYYSFVKESEIVIKTIISFKTPLSKNSINESEYKWDFLKFRNYIHTLNKLKGYNIRLSLKKKQNKTIVKLYLPII